LAEVNELDPVYHGSLRIAAQARREGGNESVDLAYLALGRAFHEQRERAETLEKLEEIARAALPAVGLDPELATRALADDSTLADVLQDHREAVEKLGAFGVPWLQLDDGTSGFFGPVVGERLRGEQSLKLWDHFVWMSSQPALYELKRGRANLPKLHGLSADFATAAPATSRRS
jgi:2-hydroxychromene-2-carboxylate isomerase